MADEIQTVGVNSDKQQGASPHLDWKEKLKEAASDQVVLLLRLGIILLVLGGLIKVLELDKVLPSERWDERTILALALVLTFCVAVFSNLKDETTRMIKDLVVMVLAFYFGVTASNQKPQEGMSVSVKADKTQLITYIAGGSSPYKISGTVGETALPEQATKSGWGIQTLKEVPAGTKVKVEVIDANNKKVTSNTVVE